MPSLPTTPNYTRTGVIAKLAKWHGGHNASDNSWGRLASQVDPYDDEAVAYYFHQSIRVDAKRPLLELIMKLKAQLFDLQNVPPIDPRQQRATMIAALRYYQQEGQGEPSNRSDLIHELATSSDTVISLDSAGIEELIEFLTNTGCEANDIPIGARVLLRRGGHDAPAPGQLRDVKATYIASDDHQVQCRLEQDDPDATVGWCTKKGDIGWWSRSIMRLDPAP